MKLLFDARFARPRHLDGVGRFVWATLGELPDALDADDELLVLCLREDVAAFREHLGGRARLLDTSLPIASLAQQARWPDLVRNAGVDVVFYPQFDLPLVPDGVAAVATVYDLTPIQVDGYFGTGRRWRAVAARGLLARTCARADIVTTLSHASADALAAHRPDVARRLRMLPPGPTRQRRQVATPQPGRFVYVGNHRPHKRVDVLIAAAQRARGRRPDLELVLLGRPDPRFPEALQLAARSGAAVRVVKDAADDEVAGWLASAWALVFASHGEGFGFPVLEAFAQGTPALVANAGSLPEVAGAGGLVVGPPDDAQGWAEAMVEFSMQPELRARLAAGAQAALAARTWSSTAKAVVDACRAALGGRR